jgi:hypothetical protein
MLAKIYKHSGSGTMRKPFCVVPFVEAFSGYESAWRNCCAADPQITSLPDQTFEQWQQDHRLQSFRQRLQDQTWQPECHKCQRQEQESGHSFRTAVNDAVDITDTFGVWPSRWNLKFGNICNLACWTCNEQASSVIAQHLRRLDLLPLGFQDPEQEFQQQWPELQQAVLKSYDYHAVVTITLVGGEPMYNRTVAKFLQHLLDLGLAARTRLEFHTNATHVNPALFAHRAWNHVCAFLSLDAVGARAEWLRYGSSWSDIEHNIGFFHAVADYVEVHCTLSVLNIGDLVQLQQFCDLKQLPLQIGLLTEPDFMNLLYWPGDPALLADAEGLATLGHQYYYEQIGSQPDATAPARLEQYFAKFGPVRGNLADRDPKLFHAIKVSKH